MHWRFYTQPGVDLNKPRLAMLLIAAAVVLPVGCAAMPFYLVAKLIGRLRR